MKHKWSRILAGERVICSQKEIDAFPFHAYMCSEFNPRGVGVLMYVAYLSKCDVKAERHLTLPRPYDEPVF